MNANEFEALKRKIEEAKTKKERLNGQLEQLNEQMQAEFGCKTLEELETLFEETLQQKEKLEQKFKVGMAELEKLAGGLI